MIIFDTDILIWGTRQHAKAVAMIENTPDKQLSAVTYMEMLQGMRNRAEQQAFEKFIKQHNFTILSITSAITATAIDLVKAYNLSHSMQIYDALIASTALNLGIPLMSANRKHYQFIPKLKFIPFFLVSDA